MKRLFLLFSLVLSMQFGVASAATQYPIVWCRGCTTAQMTEKAKFAGAGLGIVYVGDQVSRTILAFDVSRDVVGYDEHGNPIYGAKTALPAPTSPTYVAAANELIDFYNTTPTGWVKTFDRAGSGANSVYEIVNKGTRQNRFINERKADAAFLPTVFTEMAARVAAVFKITDGAQYPQVLFDYTFPDGSRIKLKFDLTKNTLEVVDDSGVDKNDNPVLSQRTDRIVEFDLRDADDETINNWGRQMTLLTYNPVPRQRAIVACVGVDGKHYCFVVSQ